jgi:hypothetical protein
LERSVPPSWTDAGAWRRDYTGKPVRIAITCRREGYEPWVIPLEVEVTAPGASFV